MTTMLSMDDVEELGTASASQEIRDVANAFVRLQKRRHGADYAPSGKVTPTQTRDLVEVAEVAIQRLRAADDEERRNFLADLMLPVRAG